MDYRHRDYYLVELDTCAYDMRVEYFKIAAPTLKFHAPYNHIKNSELSYDKVDNVYGHMMISCKHIDSGALEYELRKAVRRDNGTCFCKLTKEICGH